MSLELFSPVIRIKGIGEKYALLLQKNCINSVLELLLHFPVYYIDLENFADKVEPGVKIPYLLNIKSSRLNRNYARRISTLRVAATFGKAEIELIIFNQPYLLDFFRENDQVLIYGEVTEQPGFQVINPLVFAADTKERVVPVYNSIATIRSGKIKNLIRAIFTSLLEQKEFLPAGIVEKYNFPPIIQALKAVHFPAKYDPAAIDRHKHRFIFHEFFLFQLELQYIRSLFKRRKRNYHYTFTKEIRAAVNQSLKFKLTSDQEKAFEDIVNSLKGKFTMQRLLMGDVGSGKTVIAFLALLLAIKNGYQGAFLVPTEILAQQHFSKALRFFPQPGTVMLSGSTPAAEKKEILTGLKKGTINIVIGTHALLNEKVVFKNLSMVIIDEQHRFGVAQRAAMFYKSRGTDLLVTTATPIPRTLLLSLYNDLSLSTIKEKPANRLPIKSKIIGYKQRRSFYLKMREKIEAGAKAYIILPLIEKSDHFVQLRSIEEDQPYYRQIFKGVRTGFLSGRVEVNKKEQLLQDFKQGKIKLIISTTVIEVGIDISDATIMVIENADRYGLSQLHQLRGRVGRGPEQSYCFLIPSENITDRGRQRLKTIASMDNGFKIAEVDLKMRGGGIISGLQQSGYLDFKTGDIKRDYKIFQAAKKEAGEVLADKSLQNDFVKDFLKTVKEKAKKLNFS